MNNATQIVHVAEKGHCNQDSFPLRFGFRLPTNTNLEVKVLGAFKPSSKFKNRTVFDADFQNPETGEWITGTLVTVTNPDQRYPRLVTAWRHDEDAEFYLSEVLKKLRESGTIDSDWLLSKHEDYRSGRLRTHTDLIKVLTKEKTEQELERITEETNLVIERLTDEMESLKRTAEDSQNRAIRERERAESAEAQAQKEKERADYNEQWARIKEQEVERYKREQEAATRSGSSVTVTQPDVLLSVDEGVIYNNSACTQLTFANGDRWYMKTSTFDRDGRVTNKAKKLVGYRVRVTSWDPVSQPGKWSSLKYFRHVYLVDQS
jgi:hypothetical protein